MVIITRCTHCNSVNVVWDYERGYIVCGDCGTVIDVIYQSHITFNLNKQEEICRSSKRVNSRIFLNKHTKTYLELVRKAYEYGLTVDNEVFKQYSLGHSPLVKVFKKPNVELSRLTSDRSMKLVLDMLMKYPRLASRTDRAKVALAKIALSTVSEGKLDIKKLSRELNLSEVHIRRLYKVVISEFKFLEDVRTLLTSTAEVVRM